MYNKIFFLLMMSLSNLIVAQNTVHSPFSSYGFGERTYNVDAVTSALGQTAICYFDTTLVNFHNPATYNTLSQGQPLFSLGILGRLSKFSENDVSSKSMIGMIDHFAMAFPIKKHFGLAFGLKPYSRRGYEISDRVATGTDSVLYQYLGYGGANEVFIGLSSTLVKYKNTTLSAGTNLSYLFGNASNERRSSLINGEQHLGGVDIKTIRFKSFHYEFGTYLEQKITPLQTLKISATLEPEQDLNVYKDEVLYFSTNVNTPSLYSILSDTNDVNGKLHIAPTFSFGFSYSLRTTTNDKSNRTKNSEWLFLGSYSATDWTQYSTRFSDVSESYTFDKTSKLSFGVQYTPEYKFLENQVSTNFFERMHYRVGYYQFNLPYTDSGLPIKEFGTTFGFGIPIVAQQALSSVNVSFTYGKRGAGEAQSLNEEFIGINFGVIIAPSAYDRWFKKRKLD